MLRIEIPAAEQFDEATNRFIYTKAQTLQLEHSLVSLSKWESKWHKPFLGKEKKTAEETIDYLRHMTITQNVDPQVYYAIPNDKMAEIKAYIDDSMTATWFSEGGKQSNEVITAEIIYDWMIAFNIPAEYAKWHLNRLLTLIRVRSIKSAPQKKMKKEEQAKNYRALNAARKKQYHSKG